MVFALYRAATVLGAPAIRLYLHWRRYRGKEDPARFSERLGVAGMPRPPGPVIWVHAASIGESLSILPLVERMCQATPSLHVLVTTGTVTSAKLMGDRLPEGGLHQFSPIDLPRVVARFLDHWRPDLVLWVESEFWPNVLSEIRARDLPAVLLNARISDRSFRGWQRMPTLAAKLLSTFRLSLAQSDVTVDRLRRLGGENIACVGNLKYAAPPLPVATGPLGELKAGLKNRPCWLAASVHPGEERLAAQVHGKLKAAHPGLLTFLVPRHPALGVKMAARFRAEGLCVARRAGGDALTAATDIYLADTLGELGLFYRLAPIAFVGGSLVPHGGQNLLEPARLDCAILHGPHVENFARIAEALQLAGAAEQVANGDALADAVAALLEMPDRGRRMADAAKQVAAGEAGVLDRVVERLQPYLDGLGSVPNDAAKAGPGA